MSFPDSVYFYIIWGLVTIIIFHKQLSALIDVVLDHFSEDFPSYYHYRCFDCNDDGSSCSKCPYNKSEKEGEK